MRKLLVVGCLVLAGCGARAEHAGEAPVAVPPAWSGTATSKVEVPVPQLSPEGKEALTRARRDGADSVVLLLSTAPGATERVAARLRDLGASVEASDATVGYVRASVPLEAVQRATTVDGVSRVDVDEPVDRVEPTP
ncbi:hypothetical protein [Saccharothrix coeruleofusca]|uniref:hypothetical protein n=1 Tax=Saccharothrix coeruleofusca TaxID=33919 RepID=UPI00167013FC|nr:hypothetical protein [Saccharothrix coeruleofusca]MBP2338943.1 hypothetical protein [Saccharothrix coeruleofusca]